MVLKDVATKNENNIKNCKYPGRGIIIGMTPSGENMVQLYWIMGRSENSRNRIFKEEDGFVRTKAFDEKKLIDPSLVIYYPVKYLNNKHIVTNGDQTDTIYDYLNEGKSFENALYTREFEPDHPNYTPRISGIIDFDDEKNSYQLSILKSIHNDSTYCQRMFFGYEKPISGFGHYIHTYDDDGDPIPSFSGEPKIVSLKESIQENINYYWDMLDEDNKVSLLVKFIDLKNHNSIVKIINKNK